MINNFAPKSHSSVYSLLYVRFVAKAVLDQRHVDLPFSTPFLKTMLNQSLSFSDLVTISPSLGRSLGSLVELCKRVRNC